MKNIFVCLIITIVAFILIFTVISVTVFEQNERSLFGYKAYIVRSDSMSTADGDKEKGYFSAGDLVIVKEVAPSSLDAGDIISYKSTNPENFGETVTHMIRRRETDNMGNIGFITYGTDKNIDDTNLVTYDNVLGKYCAKVPKIGSFFAFLKTAPGFMLCVFAPIAVIIIIQIIKSIMLFKQYKSERLSEIDTASEKERSRLEAERAELAEERKRQEEMLEKLLKIQEDIKANSSNAGSVPKEDAPQD